MADKDSRILPAEDAQDTPCDFKEPVSTMEPNCLDDTTTIYLESCEPFSVTNPVPSNNLDEPDISQTNAIVNPLNSIVISESSEPIDNIHEIKYSSTRRSTRKSTSNQKMDTKLAVRKCWRTSGKRPIIDLLPVDVERRRRSDLVKRVHASDWGLGGKIDKIFKQNAEKNVNENEHIETRKGRMGRRGGKRNTDFMNQSIQNSKGESRSLNKGLLLKFKLGTKAIQNCQFNTIPDMDKGRESYREVKIEASNLQSDIKENYQEELPSASISGASNESLGKGVVPSKTSVIDALLADRDTREAVVGKVAGDMIGMEESVENRCLDPGTSPDSEVINVIPETQMSGIAEEGLHDIRIPSKDCVGRQSGDCGVGSGVPSPEIISDILLCNTYEHGEKLIEGSCSSGVSMSITTGVASSNPSCREGCPMEPMVSLQGTEVGIPIDVLAIESGRQTDLGIAGIESVDSHFSEKPLPFSKSNGQNNSRSKGMTKSMSEVPDTVNKKRTNTRPKGSQAKSTGKGKIKEKNGNDQAVCDMESHPVTGNHETDDVVGLEEGCRSAAVALSNSIVVPSEGESQQGSPRSAWVCCDECHKWRRIPARLADSIESTECRWICKDNMDKAFADCSILQEKSNADINEELEISDASCEEDASNSRLNSSQLGQKQPIDPPQSTWKLIKTNMFLHRNRKNQTIDEIMVCHCKPSVDGHRGCRDECLNRMLNIECVKGTCPCGEFCSNQQFQKRKYAKLKCFQCGKKGYGLQLQEDIPKGRFLIEYVGEVLDMPAYEARQKEYASRGHKHFYFMTLNGSEVIDACAKGNLGRFINHSCEPNCRTEKWMVNGEVCIGLFAVRDIKKGEELTFDYNYVRVFGAAAKKCVCGSSRCRGFIGGDPLNAETVVLGDSDDECAEPVTFYENSSIKLDNMLSEINTFEGTVTETSESTCKSNDDLTTPIESAEREASFERSSSVASPSESKIEQTEELLSTSMKSNDAKKDVKGEKTKTAQNSLVNLSPDTGDTKKKPKALINENKCVILKPKSRSKLPGQSSMVKRGKSKTHGVHNSKLPDIDSKSLVAPHKTKRLVEDCLTGRFEAVQEALNILLNSDGGISKRRDASKGYLKLLCQTAASGHSGNGEGIQSNRDLSMILDALLKTQSRSVLLDIINKNGLQLLHNLMKRYRKEFNKIPILRKLLKVLEYLAETKILTLENIIKPSRLGAESFKESMLSLAEHADKQVHQIARNFRDRFIPRSFRKINWVERTEFEPKNLNHSSDHDKKLSSTETPDKQRDPTTSVSDGPGSCVTDGPRPRKRKSRWDQPGDLESSPSNKDDADVDAPPGFSSPIKAVSGHPQERYLSRLPIAYGVPSSVFRQTEGASAGAPAPGMAFHPFPPLPSYPKQQSPGVFNQRFRNDNTLGRRYFKQQKWNNNNNNNNNNYNNNNNNGWNGNKIGFNGGNGYYRQQ